jgi:hypothetical protein
MADCQCARHKLSPSIPNNSKEETKSLHRIRSRINIARKRAQRTPLGLQRYRAHPPPPHAISELVQSWQGHANVPAAGARPEYLCRCRGARPDDRVEILWARLFGPEELLPTQHEFRLRGGQVREWVEGVGLQPEVTEQRKRTKSGEWTS